MALSIWVRPSSTSTECRLIQANLSFQDSVTKAMQWFIRSSLFDCFSWFFIWQYGCVYLFLCGLCRLEENYTMITGSCLARSVIYTHYQDFCKKNHLVPHSAASFGKVRHRHSKVLLKATYRELVCTRSIVTGPRACRKMLTVYFL